MCGITGALHPGRTTDEWPDILGRMALALRHRGPDDQGFWFDAAQGIGLAHRRLSILDLSPAGHQPMHSASGRYVLSYNGEVYNHHSLRRELVAAELAPVFRGHSDTEVLLAAMEAWGVPRAVARFRGIFALAVWDRSERCLHLARDPLGVKPLYHGLSGGAFLFGSELSAVRRYPTFDAGVNRDSVALLLRFGYIASPHCIYHGFAKLEPGTLLTVRPDPEGGWPRTERQVFWSAREAVERGSSNPFPGGSDEAVSALEAHLVDAVGSQMESDVPLGVFLSGGIDSSLVTALAQRHSHTPVRTFSVGFRESEFDEAPRARAVADYLGTLHTELTVSAADGLALVPEMARLYDEPFADSSQLPTCLLARVTRKHVTVSLSGDGGDELFAGYGRYLDAERVWKYSSWLPPACKRTAAWLLRRGPGSEPGAMLAAACGLLPLGLRTSARRRSLRLAQVLEATTPQALYTALTSQWMDPAKLVLDAREPSTLFDDPTRWARVPSFLEHMIATDLADYLPEDVLTKVDRASMAVGLEVRVPILDPRVVEFAATLPRALKVEGTRGKRVLRQLLYRHVPAALVDRPKMGFGVPIGKWLRRELRDWAEGLLDETRLRAGGFLEPAAIRRRWTQHLSGGADWSYALWHVLMFQAWLETHCGSGSTQDPIE